MRYTIERFQKQFPDTDSCLDYIFNRLYGKKFECPGCERKGPWYRIKGKKFYDCSCGHRISPLAGTIFHKSSTTLTKWFYAIYLMSVARNGVAAKELQRQLGVTYKTAWRIQKQVRALMTQGTDPLTGTVEMDETYIGGKGRKGQMRRKYKDKAAVVGIVQRQGIVLARAVPNVKGTTVLPILRKNVKIGTNLMTDDFPVYDKAKGMGYVHKTVRHTRKEYARGSVHTNTIEGFWSQLKRSMSGTYHAVSPKYLQTYVDEFAYRYNHRSSLVSVFHLLLARVVSSQRQ